MGWSRRNVFDDAPAHSRDRIVGDSASELTAFGNGCRSRKVSLSARPLGGSCGRKTIWCIRSLRLRSHSTSGSTMESWRWSSAT